MNKFTKNLLPAVVIRGWKMDMEKSLDNVNISTWFNSLCIWLNSLWLICCWTYLIHSYLKHRKHGVKMTNIASLVKFLVTVEPLRSIINQFLILTLTFLRVCKKNGSSLFCFVLQVRVKKTRYCVLFCKLV